MEHSRLRRTLLTIAAVALSLPGCQTTQEDSAQDERDAEKKGTVIGGATGAAVGAATGKGHTRTRNAVIGAIVGGIAGNRIGAYMDQQEQELKKKLAGTGVKVERNGERINLVMPGDVTFPTEQSNIEDEFRPTLKAVADVLEEYEKTQILIEGHTDAQGAASYNQTLSEQRARSVASFLRKQGVIEERLVTEGLGESQPIAENSTAEGRQKNRRVDLSLVPVVAE